MPVNYGALPFKEQLAFFRAKLNLPTQHWDDLLKAAHDRAFVVAGAMKADLLADLRKAVDGVISGKTTLEAFRKDFKQIVAQRGWTGWTGQGTKAGEAWRTRVIYDTNLFSSYAAGRYEQMQAVKADRPYWRYRHSDAVVHPRPVHVSWNRKILHADDPWWKTAYPPNGFRCKCFVDTLSARDLARMGIPKPPMNRGESMPFAGETQTVKDRQGNLHTTPKGIDRGWDYAPGANRTTPLYDLIARKLPTLDAPLGAAMWASLKDAVAMEQQLKLWAMIDLAKQTKQSAGEAIMVHGIEPTTVQSLADVGIKLQSAEVWLRDEQLIHALRDTKTNRSAELPEEVWRDLPRYLAKATPYLDTKDRALVYAFDAPDGTGKVVVRINYTDKLREGEKRVRVTTNFIRTAGVVDPMNISGDSRYKELK